MLPLSSHVAQVINIITRNNPVEEEAQGCEKSPTNDNQGATPESKSPGHKGLTKSSEKRIASSTESSPPKDRPTSLDATLVPCATSPNLDISEFEALLDLDPADAMNKLLAGEFSYSSKMGQGSSDQTSSFTSSSTMNIELQKFKDLVLEKCFLKFFPTNEDLQKQVSALMNSIEAKHKDLTLKQFVDFSRISTLFKAAFKSISESLANHKELQDCEAAKKEAKEKLVATRTKLEKYATAVSSGKEKMEEVNSTITNLEAEILHLQSF